MSWKHVCSSADVAKDTLKGYDVDGVRVLIANYGQGFRAFPPVCPHMEEPLEESGILARCVLTCTKHLWAWNLETLGMEGPAEKPLKTYDVKEEDGKLYVLIEEELTYEFEDEEDEMDDDFFAQN